MYPPFCIIAASFSCVVYVLRALERRVDYLRDMESEGQLCAVCAVADAALVAVSSL